MNDELMAYRRWTKEHEALLGLLCHAAGIRAHTCYRVTLPASHPEDDIRWAVEAGENGSGDYVIVRYGSDSDVAKLMNLLELGRPVTTDEMLAPFEQGTD